jgi:hypothetical protein
MNTKACPLRYAGLATQPTAQPAAQLATQPASRLATQPVTQLATQLAAQLATQLAAQLVTQPTTQPTAQPTTRPTARPTAQPTARPATQAATKLAEPPLRHEDPHAIYQRYTKARDSWYKNQPYGSIKTNQEYRKAVGLPLRYSKASFSWCLEFTQMTKRYSTSTGVRDWTKEEMMAYLD